MFYSGSRVEQVLKSIKRSSLFFSFLTLLGASACSYQNDGSLLVLEGDEKKHVQSYMLSMKVQAGCLRNTWMLDGAGVCSSCVMAIAACQNR